MFLAGFLFSRLDSAPATSPALNPDETTTAASSTTSTQAQPETAVTAANPSLVEKPTSRTRPTETELNLASDRSALTRGNSASGSLAENTPAAAVPAPSPRAEEELAAVLDSPPSEAAPAVPVRPMTATSTEAPPPPEAARLAERVQTPAPALVEAPAEAEPSSALARAAVTPTRAVREAVGTDTSLGVEGGTSVPEAFASEPDPIVAARPRPQTFPGDRASVSAPAPSIAAPSISVSTPAPVETLPLAELGPPRTQRSFPEAASSPAPRVVPEAAPIAGSIRPGASPAPSPPIAQAASSSRPGSSASSRAAPIVQLVDGPGLPDLTVIRTSWHPTADRRSAKIRLEEKNELVTLREGDSVGGMTIYEISPSAVVFSAGEVQVRRRVGEASSGR